jgi:hypothetical protein
MIRLTLLLTLACGTAVASTSAIARGHHHYSLPARLLYNPYNPCSNPGAVMAQGPYVRYNPCNDPNAVFVAGTYAGSDPDPNIRAALRREFGRI